MQRAVTHVPVAASRAQACGEQVEDMSARRLIAAGLCTASLQDQDKQYQRNAFRRLWPTHVLGLPALYWAWRGLWQGCCRGVFGYRPAFEKYQRERRA